MSNTETHKFETEVQQLLHLMIHSLYSDKEIFLRELISNASDAADRLRFESLTNDQLISDGPELAIHVTIDKKKKTITVSDNGIGMSRDEVVENIGTIARSGTKEFVDALTGDQTQDANLIGQFGVGFYSVFMVAEKVVLTTRKAGSSPGEAVHWESDGSGKYTIENVTKDTRGTDIVLTLRSDQKEFLDSFRLRSIIGKYSDHISLPIRMPASNDADKKQKTEKLDWETVNKGSALWTRNKKDVSQDDYQAFYTTLSYDPEPPLSVIHNRVEGKLEYTILLFIPSKAPFDLWDRERRHGVKLYVRRIFIMDDAEQLMPAYLRFIRGVVDSADLPLNVSREFLQKNKDIDKIRAGSVKKVLAELKRLSAKEPEQYHTYWEQFGRVFKEGIIEDHDNRQTINKLLRFASTKDGTDKQTVSLEDYVNRMPASQKAIYYLTADTYGAATQSPHLEIFRKNDIEVLLLSDPIDEWVVNHLTEYNDKPLKSVAKGALDLDQVVDEDEKDRREKEYGSILTRFKEILKDQVKDVRITHRLTDSPACLVADENDIGTNLERILKSIGQSAPEYKPILELNPDHPMISDLDPDNNDIEDWAYVLFDQAALSEGAQIKEPAVYVRRVNQLLSQHIASKPTIITEP
jgi:molecular chaperone HtpG